MASSTLDADVKAISKNTIIIVASSKANPHFHFPGFRRGVSIPNTTKMSSTDKEDNRTVGEQTTTACTELGEWVNETAM